MKIKLIITAIIIAIIAAVIIVIANRPKEEPAAPPPPEVITETTLKNIIDVSELSTFEAVYNGVARIADEADANVIDYYVSYEATVKAGIDFDAINIDLNKQTKVITITLPKVKINDTNVDISSLDYIFVDKAANTSTVSGQAYKKCIEDAESKSMTEEEIYNIAEENARNIIKALVLPFISQLDEGYSLVIN